MTIGEKLEASKNGLDALLDYANRTTGADDSNIGDAIKTLADGYGGGSDVDEVTIEFDLADDYTSTTNGVIAVLDNADLSEFVFRHFGNRGEWIPGAVCYLAVAMRNDCEQTIDNATNYKCGYYLIATATNVFAYSTINGSTMSGASVAQFDQSYSLKIWVINDPSKPHGLRLEVQARCRNANYQRVIKAGHYTFTVRHLITM